MAPMKYHDTRGLAATEPMFSEVVVSGIAPGGGLFVPASMPEVALDEVLLMADQPYWQRASSVFGWFGVDVRAQRVFELMRTAYGDQWNDERVAPVREVVAGVHVLELWHGPTSAFKDMALQCMPLFFSEAISALKARGKVTGDYLILVATSGDTGKAALEGFADRPHTGIVVFYPAEGVSDIQRKQMVSQQGDNVGVFGVRGNFDDCQNSVKAAFADLGFAEELKSRFGLSLSSANSINWGRMLPQIAYYASAYADMVREGGVPAGDPIDVCVPTGNFGNILGAYYAKKIGIPIGRLICASNENNVLSDFIATGTYDISERDFVATPSPSMDILISSNLERLLYDIAGPEAVRGWMQDLAENRMFRVDRDTFETIRGFFDADYVSNDDSLVTIKRVCDETGYLMDPHTAVAWEVAERMRGDNPVLVVSTAHWAKFGTDVLKALRELPYDDPLPSDAAALSGVQVLGKVCELAPTAAPVPHELAGIATAHERWRDVIDSGCDSVEAAVKSWLAR